jgi:hypothetical protein
MRYSMTWSACNRSVCGIVRPSALAVLRLITSSNFRRVLDGEVGGLGPLEDLSSPVFGHSPPSPLWRHEQRKADHVALGV